MPHIYVDDVKALAWLSRNGRAKLGVVRQPSLRIVLPVGCNYGGLVGEHLLQAGRVGRTHDVHEESPCLQPCRQVVDASTNGLRRSTFHHLQRLAATAELQLKLAWGRIRGGDSIGQQLGEIYKVTLQYFLSYSLGNGEITSVGRLSRRLSSSGSRGSDGGQHWSDRLRQGNGDGGMYFLPHKLAQIVIPAPVRDLGSRRSCCSTLQILLVLLLVLLPQGWRGRRRSRFPCRRARRVLDTEQQTGKKLGLCSARIQPTAFQLGPQVRHVHTACFRGRQHVCRAVNGCEESTRSLNN